MNELKAKSKQKSPPPPKKGLFYVCMKCDLISQVFERTLQPLNFLYKNRNMIEGEPRKYLDKEGEPIDFEKKRFKFWLENVPQEIRRYEYELWQLHRKLLHRKFHQFDAREKVGRFTKVPAFSEEEEKKYWQEFTSSFLKGENRAARLREITEITKEELPNLINRHNINGNKTQLIALSGSSFYGPREPESLLTDVDLHFLLNEPTDESNFEIFPKLDDNEFALQYHIIGTGNTDMARGERSEIHWLLYPHYPIINTLEDPEAKELIKQLSAETLARKGEIEEQVKTLEDELQQEAKAQYLDKYE